MKTIYAAIVVALMLTSGSAIQAQFYTLNPDDGLVNGVSDNGIAVGSFLNGDNQYFKWEIGVGGKVNIGGTPAGGGVGGQASISDDGTRIGGTDFHTSSGFYEMSFYESSSNSWTPVGGIGSSSDGSISSGWGISGDGLSLVGLGWVNAGEAHAIHWRSGSMIDLGSTVTGRSTRANATNLDGSVIGGWQDDTFGFRQGAVWVNNVQELIVSNSGEQVGEVSAISGDGKFATGLEIVFGIANTYRYDVDNDIFHELTNIMETSRMAGAAINGDGTLIGGGMWGFGPALFGDGYVWEEGIGTMLVADYLTSKGISGWGTGFEFSFVTGISTNGDWIVGWGRDANGNNVSWAAHISGQQSAFPESFEVTHGTFVFGAVADLAESDDTDVSVRRSSIDVQSRTEIECKATSLNQSPFSFEFTLEASVFARSKVNQTIELFDYDAGAWMSVDVRPASRFIDTTVTVATVGDLARFVDDGTGCIEARVRFQSVNPRQRFASNIDQVIWTIK